MQGRRSKGAYYFQTSYKIIIPYQLILVKENTLMGRSAHCLLLHAWMLILVAMVVGTSLFESSDCFIAFTANFTVYKTGNKQQTG